MKRIAIAAVAILMLGFYVGWPAWSGYVIRSALQNKDANALASKIDFERVQASMRPAVMQKVAESYDRYQAQLGPAGGLILGQLRKDAMPRIVDASLKAMLTPEMMIRIASEAGPIKDTIERIMREQIGRGMPANGGAAVDAGGADKLPQGLGGMLGRVLKGSNQPAAPEPDAAPAPSASQPKQAPRFSLSNVKSFAFAGPLSFSVGVAKDPATPDADVTAQMSFTGGDWKVTGLLPRP
jgi:Protein of unknown function (DUF2939)